MASLNQNDLEQLFEWVEIIAESLDSIAGSLSSLEKTQKEILEHITR